MLEETKPINMEELVQAYLASLTPKEMKAYEIARDHLGMSYQVVKSIAFQKFCKKYNPPITPESAAAS
jgi:hypothetical protein